MVLQEHNAPGKLLPSQNASWAHTVSVSAQHRWQNLFIYEFIYSKFQILKLIENDK